VRCWDKECETSIAPLSKPQWGLPLIEPPRPHSLDYNRRSKSDGRKLSTSSTPRTPAARRGEPSTNILAGLDAPPACAPSRQILSPRNWGRTGHTRLATMSQPWFVNKQLSDLLKIPAPEGHCISEPFRQEEFATALRRLKPGKSPVLDSNFLEFILLAGLALKSWFCDSLISCMRQLKIPKIWRTALVVAIPKPEKPLVDPISYHPISAVRPL